MQLLVTGLSGFVGSHCARLLGGADLLYEGRLADLRQPHEVLAAVQSVRPDRVLHLAAQSFVPHSIQDPTLTHEVNVVGTQNLIEALATAGFTGRMLYVGSADAYGIVPPDCLPVVEDYPLRPLNPYAQSKADAEAVCRAASEKGQFEIVVARPFNHIGPGQSTRFAVASFARQIAACAAGHGPSRLVCGNLDTTRDFTDVRDVVHAYSALLRSGHNGQAYNVCTGVERSMRDVVDAMMEAAGVRLDIEIDESLVRKTEQQRMCGSFAKLHAHTGWQPEIAFRQTLIDTLAHWQKEDAS